MQSVNRQSFWMPVTLLAGLGLAACADSDVQLDDGLPGGGGNGDGVTLYSVSGEVQGLAESGLVLSLNDEESLVLDEDGAFSFDQELEDGDDWAVTVSEQPGQATVCELDNASGVIMENDVDDVQVACEQLAVGTVTDHGAIHLDWHRDGLVDIAYSTDHQCDWNNVSVCENGALLADVDGGSLSLTIEDDGLEEDAAYSFVMMESGQVSYAAVGAAASYQLDDTVRDTVIAGDHVFAAGDFTHYAPDTGGLAVIRNDLPEASLTGPVSRVRGSVMAMAESPQGGWYIAGLFDQVQGHSRDNIARLHPDGTIDGDWDVSLNGAVMGLHVSDERVYVAGDFDDVDGDTDYAHLVALSHSGEVDTAFSPDTPSATLWAMEMVDERLHVAGQFTGMGASNENFVAALDPADGSVDADFSVDVDGPVYALAAMEDGRLALGGPFDEIDGQSREMIGVVDLADGSIDENFNADVSGLVVLTILPIDDDLLIGGYINAVDSEDRPGIARISGQNGDLDEAWAPDFEGGIAWDVLLDDDRVYVAGILLTESDERVHLQRLDRSSGLADADWQPELRDQAASLNLVGNNVWVGGSFNAVGGVAVDHFAAFHRQDGRLDEDWDPAFDAPVHALAVGDDALFIGGQFEEFTAAGSDNTQPHAYATALHLDTGGNRGWQPQPDNHVYALDVRADENAVFLGGLFGTIKGQDYQRLAVVDVVKGDPLSGSENPEVAGSVLDLTHVPGSNAVLFGGSFSAGPSNDRTNAWFVDHDDLGGRNFTIDPDDTVRAVDSFMFGNDSRHFIGGDFQNAAGESSEHFLIADGNNNRVDGFDLDDAVHAIDFLPDEDRLLMGGDFSDVTGQGSRNRFAALDYDGTDLTLRSETVDFDRTVRAIDQTPDYIAVGGDFNTVAGQRHGRIVLLDADTLQPVWNGSDLSTSNLQEGTIAPSIPQWEPGSALDEAGQ